MIGLLAPILISLGAVWLRAGSLVGLRQLRIYWWPVALVAIAAQLVLHNAPVNQQPWAVTFGPMLWTVSMVAILAVAVRNILQPGLARVAFAAAAVGLGLNLIAVTANGGYMPQSTEARIAARGVALPSSANVSELYNVSPIGPDTRLAWLGDIIAQPRWLPRANVVSVGDIVLSLSLAALVFITIGRGAHQWEKAADS